MLLSRGLMPLDMLQGVRNCSLSRDNARLGIFFQLKRLMWDSDKQWDKRPNHKSQDTDARGMWTPATILCIVDFKKAFDSISHDNLWVAMMDMGYPLHLIDLLAKLYRKQLAKVKVAGTLSEWFRVKKGVRQGCVLSPYLFNTLAEMVMRETLDGFQGGLQIGRVMVTNLHYADDIILLATSEAELQDLVDHLDRVCAATSTRPR